MARRQVNYDPQGDSLRPVAGPAPFVPFVPSIAKPNLLPVQELAGLSEALQDVSLQQAEKENKRARQAGLDDAAAAPPDTVQQIADAGKNLDDAEAKVKANQDAYASAAAAGKIHPSQNPWYKVGFTEGAAHRVMQKYDAELQGRLNEVTATADAQGNPVYGADPQAIIAEVWQKYQGSPVLRDFYGSRVAQPSKAEIDAKFSAEGLRKRAEEQQKATTEWAENTLSDKFVQMSATGHTVTSEDLKSVGDFMTEARRKGVTDVRTSTYRALDGAASQVDLNDDGSAGGSRASALLRQLLDAPAGTTTVGQDAVLGAKVRDLISQYDRLHTQKQDDAFRAQQIEKKKALEDGEREALTRIQKEQSAGNGDALGVSEQYAQELQQSQQFGTNTSFVIDMVRHLGLNQKAQASSVVAENLKGDLIAGADPDYIVDSARSAVRAGAMKAEDYAGILQESEAQRSLKPLLEGNQQHQENMRDLREAAALPQIPADIGGDLRSDLNKQVDDFRAQEEAAAKQALQLSPDQREEAMRKWRQENVPAFREKLRVTSDQFRKDREAAQQEADDRLFHASSPEQILHDKGQYFSAQEKANIRARAAVQADHERFLQTDGYRDAEAFILNTVHDQYKDVSPENLRAIEEAAKRELREVTLSQLGEKLPTTDPSGQTALVRSVVDEQAPKVLERVAQTNVVRFAKAAKEGGEGVPSAQKLLDAGAADLATSERAAKAANPADAAKALTNAVNPNVSQEVRDLQRAFLGGDRRGAFGVLGHVTADDLVDRAHYEAQAIMANPQLTDADKAQAVVDMMKVSGIPAEQALAGKITLTPSDAYRAKAQRFLNNTVASQKSKDLVTKAMISSVDVDLKGAQIPVYTTPFFKTEAELKLWYEGRPDDLKALAIKYGVPDGEPAFKNWVAHQKAAIRRLNVGTE